VFYKHFVPTGPTVASARSHIKVESRLIAQLAAILLATFALKQHYSTASVNELRWILAPTTFLVELVTGSRFDFESYAGYTNSDRTFVIAASCAGVNFLIAAFLMLSLRKLWISRREKTSWSFLPLTALAAYVTTMVANTVRISTALNFHRSPLELSWMSGNQLHRFEGIFIYFGFLLLLFLLSESLSSSTKSEPPTVTSGLVFPLLVYYGTTMAIPLLNIASGRESAAAAFGEHLLFVLLTPLLLILLLLAIRFVRRLSSD
jgi:exosortase K